MNDSEQRSSALVGTMWVLWGLALVLLMRAAVLVGPFGDDIAIRWHVLMGHSILADFSVNVAGYWRPLIYTTYRLAFVLLGLVPIYGVIAVALHAMNTLLLYRWLRREGLAATAAQSAAILFLVHYSLYEVALTLPSVGDTYLVMGLLVGLGAARPTALRYLGATILAVLAKEYGVLVVGMFAFRDLVLRAEGLKMAIRRLLPSIVLAFCYALWAGYRLVGAGGASPEDASVQLQLVPGASQWKLFLNQVLSLVGPDVLSVDAFAGLPKIISLSLLPIAAIVGWAGALRSSRKLEASTLAGGPLRWLLFLVPIFLGVLVLTSLRDGAVHSRYLYLPALFWVVFHALGWHLLGDTRLEAAQGSAEARRRAAMTEDVTSEAVEARDGWLGRAGRWLATPLLLVAVVLHLVAYDTSPMVAYFHGSAEILEEQREALYVFLHSEPVRTGELILFEGYPYVESPRRYTNLTHAFFWLSFRSHEFRVLTRDEEVALLDPAIHQKLFWHVIWSGGSLQYARFNLADYVASLNEMGPRPEPDIQSAGWERTVRSRRAAPASEAASATPPAETAPTADTSR